MYDRYRGISDRYTVVNGHTLLIIAQPICRMFLLQFGKSSRDLLCISVFNKLAYHYIIIPGRESEIHYRMSIDTTKLLAKSQADDVSGIMLFYQICNIENGVCPTYKMASRSPKWCIIEMIF